MASPTKCNGKKTANSKLIVSEGPGVFVGLVGIAQQGTQIFRLQQLLRGDREVIKKNENECSNRSAHKKKKGKTIKRHQAEHLTVVDATISLRKSKLNRALAFRDVVIGVFKDYAIESTTDHLERNLQTVFTWSASRATRMRSLVSWQLLGENCDWVRATGSEKDKTEGRPKLELNLGLCCLISRESKTESRLTKILEDWSFEGDLKGLVVMKTVESKSKGEKTADEGGMNKRLAHIKASATTKRVKYKEPLAKVPGSRIWLVVCGRLFEPSKAIDGAGQVSRPTYRGMGMVDRHGSVRTPHLEDGGNGGGSLQAI
ncbi:hypothetical protein PPACK8108_LOCUS20157 [Phakopsora pachyrhizi]|uniref:Uncharacterized protein n=1 Tax=Phakopsora pachyrhizi TaxID=170000 RepID=A0AAV0BEE3_PHAPC|nr:hypothetical protein PPACK8108_LOCUS20157 [Phakopsora pachyrhizi]